MSNRFFLDYTPSPFPSNQPFFPVYTDPCVGTAVGDLHERAPSSSNTFSA